MSRCRMTGNNNLHLLRKKELTCDPSPGGGGGETPYGALEDLEPFSKFSIHLSVFQ